MGGHVPWSWFGAQLQAETINCIEMQENVRCFLTMDQLGQHLLCKANFCWEDGSILI